VGVLGRLRRGMQGSLSERRLSRRTAAEIAVKIAQTWPAEPRRGLAIVEAAGKPDRTPPPQWFAAADPEERQALWHGFDWLPDVLAAGPAARDTARQLVRDWLAEDVDIRSAAWRPDIVATRVFAWIAHFDEIAGKDPALRRALLGSLAKQRRRLVRAIARDTEGAARVRALKGLIAVTLALGGASPRLKRALAALERQLPIQFLPDGGHRSRSPSVQLQVLRDLIDIRTLLQAAKLDPPPALIETIERAAPVLRLFRHGDRRLALFNDSLEEDGVLIDMVLTRSETRGRAAMRAPDAGFERLQANKTIVIIDAGARPPSGFDTHLHAGALSFEMSYGRERIIVNCGAYRGEKPEWRQLPRASAAHSVLVVADTNATEIREDGVRNRAPLSVSCERAEHEGQQWISARHDGYRERFGLVYTRELFLAADGEDLRGEDRLSGRPGANFAVRFHLHPGVEATLVEGETTARLRLPSGGCWRLRAAGAEISLGDSIYLGSGELRKTRQIILSGAALPGGTAVRWALRREPDSGGFG
jgi:uncharacterized heparinase superfamily protein